MDNLGYVRAKLDVAVDLLANGSGSLQTRLANAYISSLAVLFDSDFPPSVLPRFKAIKAAMTDAEAIGGEGLVAAAVRDMDNETAMRLESRIVALHLAIIDLDRCD